MLPQPAFAAYNTLTKQIAINTVHDTEGGAKINALVTIMEFRVSSAHTDDEILMAWKNFTTQGSPYRHWKIVPITVSTIA